MKGRAAIIGSQGYIGSHLKVALIAKGIDVLEYSSGKTGGISPAHGIFTENLSFPEGLEVVYFLSQSPFYRQTPEKAAHLLSVNCVSTTQVAEAARKANVKKLIYASTGNVYQPSFLPHKESDNIRRDNWYSLSKVMAEDCLNLYRKYMDITVARIFGVYGPNQPDKMVPMLAENLRAGKKVFVDNNPCDSNDLDGLAISLIYIKDLVDILISLGNIDDCGVVNIANPEPVTIRQIANTLSACMNLKPHIELLKKNRESNLLADTSLLLEKTKKRNFVSLDKGIYYYLTNSQ